MSAHPLWIDQPSPRRLPSGIHLPTRSSDVAPERPPAGEEDYANRDLPSLPLRGHTTEAARLARLEYLRQATGASLDAVTELSLRAERLSKNVESLIGAVEVPVGVVGPLLFRGERVQGHVYAPAATTEGALVASATRGAKAVSLAGGVETSVVSQVMPRVPVFVFPDLSTAIRFGRWVERRDAQIRRVAERTSRYAKVRELEPMVLGNTVHLAFLFETSDAAGQNMTTSATWAACRWIKDQLTGDPEYPLRSFLIEANVSGDKKVSARSFIKGRGHRVLAEAYLPAPVLRRVLKVEPMAFSRALDLMRDGAIASGMPGFNINASNMIAAIFAATGQDIACVHESSQALLRWEADEAGLRVGYLLPALVVGTVGGGTHLPRQREFLEMMNCTGPGGVDRLAEIIAGFCLALDLSTAAAATSGDFATAHEKLGRNRPVQWLTRDELETSRLETAFRNAVGDPSAQLESTTHLLDATLGSSIVTELSARRTQKLVGLFPFRLEGKTRQNTPASAEVLAKVKPLDQEILLMINSMAAGCGPRVAEAHQKGKEKTGFLGCHLRELGIYEISDPRLRAHIPRVYDIIRNDAREIFVLVMERLKDTELLDSADDTSQWTTSHVTAAIDGIAQIHAIYYDAPTRLRAEPWLGCVPSMADELSLETLWRAILAHSVDEFPNWFSAADRDLHTETIETMSKWLPEMAQHPTALIHNDFNPRNLTFRRAPNGPRLCAYDWELATCGLPQHDLAELLAFVLPPTAGIDEIRRYVARHRRQLAEAAGVRIDDEQWWEGFRLSARHLLVGRFHLYLMGHTFRDYLFLERALESLRNIVRKTERRYH